MSACLSTEVTDLSLWFNEVSEVLQVAKLVIVIDLLQGVHRHPRAAIGSLLTNEHWKVTELWGPYCWLQLIVRVPDLLVDHFAEAGLYSLMDLTMSKSGYFLMQRWGWVSHSSDSHLYLLWGSYWYSLTVSYAVKRDSFLVYYVRFIYLYSLVLSI